MAKRELLVNFQVSTWVSSQNAEITTIRKSTRDPIHVIQVENTSTVPRDARVIGCLPDGANNLIFDELWNKKKRLVQRYRQHGGERDTTPKLSPGTRKCILSTGACPL